LEECKKGAEVNHGFYQGSEGKINLLICEARLRCFFISIRSSLKSFLVCESSRAPIFERNLPLSVSRPAIDFGEQSRVDVVGMGSGCHFCGGSKTPRPRTRPCQTVDGNYYYYYYLPCGLVHPSSCSSFFLFLLLSSSFSHFGFSQRRTY
jgi:hypothetical protein